MKARSGITFGKEVVAHVDESASRREKRTCRGCGKIGHLKKDCRSKKNDDRKRGKGPKNGGSITLAVGEGRGRNGSRVTGQSLAMAIGDDSDEEDDDWILDSGSSRHLVNDIVCCKTPLFSGECLTAVYHLELQKGAAW